MHKTKLERETTIVLTKGVFPRRMLKSRSATFVKHPTAISRLQRDYLWLKKDPLPFIRVEPQLENIFEWHFVFAGPLGTPYRGGTYHGTLLFSQKFPVKPPTIIMLTPTGYFKTNTPLCLNLSTNDLHADTWNPTWYVGSILNGLLSDMLDYCAQPSPDTVVSSVPEKQQFARYSLLYNLSNPNFCKLFPEIASLCRCQDFVHASFNPSRIEHFTIEEDYESDVDEDEPNVIINAVADAVAGGVDDDDDDDDDGYPNGDIDICGLANLEALIIYLLLFAVTFLLADLLNYMALDVG